MTIRDTATSIQGWFEDTSSTVSNEHIFDWPIGIVVVVAIGAIIGITIFSQAIGGFFGWLVGLAISSPEEMQKQIRQKYGIPSDPAMRHHWANRTGPYAPDADRTE